MKRREGITEEALKILTENWPTIKASFQDMHDLHSTLTLQIHESVT